MSEGITGLSYSAQLSYFSEICQVFEYFSVALNSLSFPEAGIKSCHHTELQPRLVSNEHIFYLFVIFKYFGFWC